MADYHSVKNTAKNGKLIRAEVRELALAAAFVWGLEAPQKEAERIYPDNPHRQEQYTQMSIMAETPKTLQNMVIEVLTNYFAYDVGKDFLGNDIFIFRNTKKLRVYRKRLEFGRKKKWRLRKNTMQYLWTAAPLAYMFIYGQCEKKKLCFDTCYFIKDAYDIDENMLAICEYIRNICKIECTYTNEDGQCVIVFSDEEWAKLLSLVDSETERLRQKFIAGKYISEI